MRKFYTIDLSNVHLVFMLKLDESAGVVISNTAQGRMYDVWQYYANEGYQWRYFVDAFDEQYKSDYVGKIMILEENGSELT